MRPASQDVVLSEPSVTLLQPRLLERLLTGATQLRGHKVHRGGTHKGSALEVEIILNEDAGHEPFHWDHYIGSVRSTVHIAVADAGLPYAVISARRNGRKLHLGMIAEGNIIPLCRVDATYDGSNVATIEILIGDKRFSFKNSSQFVQIP